MLPGVKSNELNLHIIRTGKCQLNLNIRWRHSFQLNTTNIQDTFLKTNNPKFQIHNKRLKKKGSMSRLSILQQIRVKKMIYYQYILKSHLIMDLMLGVKEEPSLVTLKRELMINTFRKNSNLLTKKKKWMKKHQLLQKIGWNNSMRFMGMMMVTLFIMEREKKMKVTWIGKMKNRVIQMKERREKMKSTLWIVKLYHKQGLNQIS